MSTTTLTTVLRLDAVANVLAGIVLVAASSWLAQPLGLGSAWPVVVGGLALVAYGVENQLVARRPSSTGLTALITVDLAFAAAALAVALADPTGAETWARWALAGVADLSAMFGIAKVVGLRSLSRTGSLSPAR